MLLLLSLGRGTLNVNQRNRGTQILHSARFLGMAVTFLFAISLQNAPAGEDETHLALIDVKGRAEWSRLLDAGLPVLAVYEGRAAVLVSGTELESLSRQDVKVTAVDANHQHNRYYLLHVQGPNLQMVEEHAVVLDYWKDMALLRAEPCGAERAARYGFGLTRLVEWSGTGERTKSPVQSAAESSQWDPFIQSIVSNVSQEEITATIRRLQDFGTRYSYSDSCRAAAEYLSERFSRLDLSVSYDLYEHEGQTLANVVAVRHGRTDSSQICVICGHYDSMNDSGDPWTIAPGADDNASGVGAVVEAARVLSSYDFNSTLFFLCFSGEEQGLIGSEHFAEWASDNGVDIRSVINVDMIAYVADPPHDSWDVNIYGDDLSYDLALFFADMVDHYSCATPCVVRTAHPQPGSDHYPFALKGYRAIFGVDAQLVGAQDHSYCAATGRYAGRKAAAYVKEVAQGKVSRDQIQKEKDRVYAPARRDSGIEWKEFHAGIARINQYYNSEFKTENLFKMGLGALERMEKEFAPQLYALDPHKLLRTVEDLTMLEHSKMIMQASLARKASRMGFQRIDYPEMDPPEWNKFLIAKLENDKFTTSLKEQRFWGNMKEQYEAHNKDYTGVYQGK